MMKKEEEKEKKKKRKRKKRQEKKKGTKRKEMQLQRQSPTQHMQRLISDVPTYRDSFQGGVYTPPPLGYKRYLYGSSFMHPGHCSFNKGLL